MDRYKIRREFESLFDLRGWADDFARTFLHYLGIGWPLMLMGLEALSSHLSPIYPHPKLADLNTNWLNPWATWCPGLTYGVDMSHEWCFGTNIAHFGGPYSIMWYWTMGALSLFGRFYPYWNNLDPFFILNFILVWRIRKAYPGHTRTALVNATYGWTALLFLIAFPQILLPLFITAGSLLVPKTWRYSKSIRVFLLCLAIAYRFPIGAPFYVWQFVFGFSVHVWQNAFPYAMTVIFWLYALSSLLKDSFTRYLFEKLVRIDAELFFALAGLVTLMIGIFVDFALPMIL